MKLGITFVVTLSAGLLAGDDLSELCDALRSEKDKARRGAVADLAELGGEDAWELVLERGLTDLSPQVADEAQLRLGEAEIGGPLLGLVDSKLALRSRSELVRLRVVEALGRAPGAVAPSLLERAIEDKDAEVRASAAYAAELRFERGAEALGLTSAEAATDGDLADLVDALRRAATRDKDHRARANSIAALGRASALMGAGEESADLLAGAGERAPDLARVALLAARPTIAALTRALEREEAAYSITAAKLLEAEGTRDAVLALAGRLASNEPLRPALQHRIVRSLRRASGLSHGASGERWLRWARDLPDDWRIGDDAQGRDGAGDEGGSTTFFGLRIVSDRVAFLVDMSGSMWSERDGEPRKDSVDVELEAALRGLPETARFDLVPYTNEPSPWKGELVPASKKTVDRAIKSFRGSGLRGKGNLWDALVPVLRDPEVDTVVILTDGAPTGGTRWNVDLMRTLLQDENRFRGVTIHVLLFDASKGLQKRWRKITEDHDGVLRVID